MITETAINKLLVQCGGCFADLDAEMRNGAFVVQPCSVCRDTFYKDGYEDGCIAAAGKRK